ncbi:MAG: chromosomal replication initiator protein DnaA [Candidatus Moranbacteria bacterium]|nr:chromosomal replication initiator protein DnaA [Candidatus Moranbacteria bacterium]
MQDNQEIWKVALGVIELSISKANFNTWFKYTSIISIEDNHVIIGVPNGFAKEWLENKYQSYILSSLKTIIPDVNSLSCIISSSSEKNETSNIPTQTIPNSTKNYTAIKKQVVNPTVNNRIQLNSRYNFDSFIVGENNELAKAACHAVCENLGKIYNPLFIYGKVGLGKTHLLQSIGNCIRDKYPEKKIIYTTSEIFTGELIESIKTNKAAEFKKEYQKTDLLIIDDVQFLSGKEKTQQEFFHIFNALYQKNKQIVISSDRPPKSISTLEERLRSRFEGGMIADVSEPDLETRIAILRTKTLEKEFYISDEILRFIAKNIKNNVRELEGALNRIVAICDLYKREPTIESVTGILSEIIDSNKKTGIQNKDIINIILEFFEVTEEDLMSKSRKKEISLPRQIAMYLFRTELKLSYPGIGKYFGGRDHTTVLHAYEKINKNLNTDEKLKRDIDYLQEKLYTVV